MAESASSSVGGLPKPGQARYTFFFFFKYHTLPQVNLCYTFPHLKTFDGFDASPPLHLSCSTSSTHLPLQQWDAFLQAFPVTLNGEPPSKRQCVQAGFPQHRHHYKKWRDIQLKNRVGYILGKAWACHVNGASSVALLCLFCMYFRMKIL